MEINNKEKKELLKLARVAIETVFDNSKIEDKIDLNYYKKKYSEKQGVFVTIYLVRDGKKELKGCIGFPYPTNPLYDAVIQCARSSAFSDPRFYPLQKDELNDIRIEISVLTVPEEITVEKPEDYFNKINIGSDGLIVKSRFGSGLLLPQVFVEWKCDVMKALEMTCQKAGLNKDCWKDKENRFYKFRAIVFSE